MSTNKLTIASRISSSIVFSLFTKTTLSSFNKHFSSSNFFSIRFVSSLLIKNWKLIVVKYILMMYYKLRHKLIIPKFARLRGTYQNIKIDTMYIYLLSLTLKVWSRIFFFSHKPFLKNFSFSFWCVLYNLIVNTQFRPGKNNFFLFCKNWKNIMSKKL